MNENIYAIIDKKGNVINTILWNGEDEWLPPDGTTVVSCDDPLCQIGGTYKGGKFAAPPGPTYNQEELTAQAEAQKQALLMQANTYTQPWQTQLLLGIISDADKASLTTWMKYYQEVQAINTEEAPDIKWPDIPN